MAGVKRSEFTEAMKDDMYGYFWEAYPEKPPVWESVFDVVISDSAFEQFTSAIGLGELLEKPEGEPIQADRPMESYTIVCKNRSFARKVPFSYETMQDAKKGANLLQNTVGSWGRGVVITKEKFYANFFLHGAKTAGHDTFNNTITGVITDPSGALTYDSKPFFSTAHPDKVGNTYANFSASNTLSADNLKTTYLTYTNTNNRDERGEVIDLMPDTLLIPPALKFTAQEILETTAVPYLFENTVNVLYSIVRPLEWSYITDTDAWFLGRLKGGLMATQREDVSLDFWQDEETMDYYARAFTRFGGCVTNWRFWYGNNLATT